MAAPSITARATPVGIQLPDGYRTVIAFALDPDISFWESTVKPPGRAVDAVDQTTMHNVTYETVRPHKLIKNSECTGKAAYDPAVKDQIDAIIGEEGAITIHYPDGSTESFFGFLKEVEFDEHARKTLPMLSYTVVVTNYDPDNDVEAGPLIVSAPGT